MTTGPTPLKSGRSDGTTAVADDRACWGVDQRGGVDRWKSPVDQLKLVRTQQRRPDGLDLDVGERLADAPVSTGAERNVAELLLAQSSFHAQESANVHNPITRHTASTSMYSLTFCVRVTTPECHHWKPAVQAAAVMLRTPPSTASHRPASHAHLRYTARNFENPVTRRSLISNARTPCVN